MTSILKRCLVKIASRKPEWIMDGVLKTIPSPLKSITKKAITISPPTILGVGIVMIQGFCSWPKPEFPYNMGMMINETERDNRSMFLHYMIENLENGLKYVENEAQVDSTKWNYIKKTIENIDAQLAELDSKSK